MFIDENLDQDDVVIWLSTTRGVLNDVQNAACEHHIQPAAVTPGGGRR